MDSLGDRIRKLREDKELPLRTVAAYLDIDQAILSKIERGQRKASRKQVVKLARYFKADENELIIAWLSDKLAYEVEDEATALQALRVAEEKVAYKKKPADQKTIIQKIRNYFKKDDRVKKVWLFGSYARGDNDFKSDVDVLIEVPLHTKFSLLDLSDIQFQLEQILTAKVDLIMNEAVRPKMMERMKNDLMLVYER
jgi:predicted nucleotidyltransferase